MQEQESSFAPIRVVAVIKWLKKKFMQVNYFKKTCHLKQNKRRQLPFGTYLLLLFI